MRYQTLMRYTLLSACGARKEQWNPNFSKPRFLKNPDNSNQKSFPLDLFHCNFTPNISNSRFLEPIFVSLGFSRNQDSTVMFSHSRLLLTAPIVISIKFLLMISMHDQAYRSWELRKWSSSPTSSIKNVWRPVRRICLLTLWLKGL